MKSFHFLVIFILTISSVFSEDNLRVERADTAVAGGNLILNIFSTYNFLIK
jgi:hypothetical protein